MAKTWVLVPLANDAVFDQTTKEYTGVGPHCKQRMAEAVRWAEENLPTAKHLWVFGAGTDKEWRRGRTLGQLAEVFLRALQPSSVQAISNQNEKNFYGTLEEIKWGVKTVQKRYPPGAVVFVFFGPWWHLLRVRLIWAMFFKKEWERARFVETFDGAECSFRHEFLGYLKIFGHRFFPQWVKTRDQTPYPAPDARFGIEC